MSDRRTRFWDLNPAPVIVTALISENELSRTKLAVSTPANYYTLPHKLESLLMAV